VRSIVTHANTTKNRECVSEPGLSALNDLGRLKGPEKLCGLVRFHCGAERQHQNAAQNRVGRVGPHAHVGIRSIASLKFCLVQGDDVFRPWSVIDNDLTRVT
jgi:hypothetical protein